MKEQQKHVPEMDFLRAFAILAVLAIHVSAGFTSIPQIGYAYFAAGGYYPLWFFLLIIELYLLYLIIVRVYHFFEDKREVDNCE